ncbi:MAG: helix-turn-helix transcriptional regulator [Clostridia bacterium]|nr:helix-turn-helix transcriptional regulator [Clostridia bacterium]MBO7249915.1 helix-turn-helix transcriptional regulator [Clostridia bacterium]
MNIGKKIKELRTKKLMTQSELAGDVITRNMLSCIENGSATPSLATLRHIAAKLGVSMGYLLADESEEPMYLKMTEAKDIKNAYLSGNFRICRDMCINSSLESDDEFSLIFAESSLALARESFAEGTLRNTAYYLDEAVENAENTVYYTEHIRSAAAIFFKYMSRISATLSSDILDEEEDIRPLAFDDFSKYVIAFDALEKGNVDVAEYFYRGLDPDSPYALHINAKRAMMERRFDAAHGHLYKILINPYKIQEPLMYFVFCDLEICCKEIKDFKGAYEYSNSKLNILQRMLRDTDN